MTQSQPSEHSTIMPDTDPYAKKSDSELASYGIVEVPLMSYEWGGYRYSNASDALAAAKRAAK